MVWLRSLTLTLLAAVACQQAAGETHVAAHALSPAFAAEARLLEAAERRHVAHRTVGVHPHGAGLDALRHAEGAADVAERHGAEQGIGNRVQQGIGIGMAEQAGGVRNLHAAENQLAAFDQDVVGPLHLGLHAGEIGWREDMRRENNAAQPERVIAGT